MNDFFKGYLFSDLMNSREGEQDPYDALGSFIGSLIVITFVVTIFTSVLMQIGFTFDQIKTIYKVFVGFAIWDTALGFDIASGVTPLKFIFVVISFIVGVFVLMLGKEYCEDAKHEIGMKRFLGVFSKPLEWIMAANITILFIRFVYHGIDMINWLIGLVPSIA